MATIESLEQRLKALEAKVDLQLNSINLGNRASTTVGSSSTELILKSNGKVKIQWGNLFLDLIRNGKINPDLINN